MDIKLLSEDIWKAFIEDKNSGPDLENIRTNSIIYNLIDSIDYYYNDEDRLPMDLFDSSRSINNDLDEAVETLDLRISRIRELAIKLVSQCEQEMKFINHIKKTSKHDEGKNY